jgi:maltose phosphorylase
MKAPSPCVHSIQAASLDKMDMAYSFYLRTSRLDLDDYNKEVEEGHITSMAGTWMSIVKVLENACEKRHS